MTVTVKFDRPFFILLTTLVGLAQTAIVAEAALILPSAQVPVVVALIGGAGSAIIAFLISETPKNGASPTTTSQGTTTTNLSNYLKEIQEISREIPLEEDGNAIDRV